MLDAVVPSHSTHTAESSSPAPQKVGLRLQGLQSSPKSPALGSPPAPPAVQGRTSSTTLLWALCWAD